MTKIEHETRIGSSYCTISLNSWKTKPTMDMKLTGQEVPFASKTTTTTTTTPIKQ